MNYLRGLAKGKPALDLIAPGDHVVQRGFPDFPYVVDEMRHTEYSMTSHFGRARVVAVGFDDNVLPWRDLRLQRRGALNESLQEQGQLVTLNDLVSVTDRNHERYGRTGFVHKISEGEYKHILLIEDTGLMRKVDGAIEDFYNRVKARASSEKQFRLFYSALRLRLPPGSSISETSARELYKDSVVASVTGAIREELGLVVTEQEREIERRLDDGKEFRRFVAIKRIEKPSNQRPGLSKLRKQYLKNVVSGVFNELGTPKDLLDHLGIGEPIYFVATSDQVSLVDPFIPR